MLWVDWASNGKERESMARIPDKVKAAMLADLKEGKGCDEIAVNHGVGRQTVFTLREKHRDELPDWKRRTAQRVKQAAEKIVDRINREADSKTASLKDLSICAGILISKEQELGGKANLQRLEVHHTIELPRLDGWIGTQNAPKVAEVVEIGGKAGTGAGFENLNLPVSDAPADDTQGHGGGGAISR